MYVNVCKQILHYLKSVHILSIIGFFLKKKNEKKVDKFQKIRIKRNHMGSKKQSTHQQSKQTEQKKHQNISQPGKQLKSFWKHPRLSSHTALLLHGFLGPKLGGLINRLPNASPGRMAKRVGKDNHLLQMNPFEVRWSVRCDREGWKRLGRYAVGIRWTDWFHVSNTVAKHSGNNRILEQITNLGGGFKHLLCSSLFGERFPIWRGYFSDGLVQPPTRDSQAFGSLKPLQVYLDGSRADDDAMGPNHNTSCFSVSSFWLSGRDGRF